MFIVTGKNHLQAVKHTISIARNWQIPQKIFSKVQFLNGIWNKQVFVYFLLSVSNHQMPLKTIQRKKNQKHFFLHKNALAPHCVWNVNQSRPWKRDATVTRIKKRIVHRDIWGTSNGCNLQRLGLNYGVVALGYWIAKFCIKEDKDLKKCRFFSI